jgi:hypothetical protein
MCKEGQAGNKKDNAAACLCFLNYLAFLRPAADRAVSILPLVVSPGRSYGFPWAGSIIQKNVRYVTLLSMQSPDALKFESQVAWKEALKGSGWSSEMIRNINNKLLWPAVIIQLS